MPTSAMPICTHHPVQQVLRPHRFSPDAYDDLYVVTELMDTDLRSVVYSKQPLTEEHCQYFTYQLLRGLK